MTTTRVELPAIWDDARDLPFFRITAGLFPPDFCLGATVLLASYDDDTVEVTPATPVSGGGSSSPTSRVRNHAEPPQQHSSAPVRRTR